MGIRITDTSDPVREYRDGLDAADTLEKLRAHLADWEEYAGEAVDCAATWTESDFADWRAGLAIERAH